MADRLRVPRVETGQHPFRRRLCDRLAELRTGDANRVRTGSDRRQLAIPLDEDIVGVARVAEIVVEIARLRRDEMTDVTRPERVLDAVELRPRVEERIGGVVRLRLAWCLQVRRIVRAEAAAACRRTSHRGASCGGCGTGKSAIGSGLMMSRASNTQEGCLLAGRIAPAAISRSSPLYSGLSARFQRRSPIARRRSAAPAASLRCGGERTHAGWHVPGLWPQP